MNAHVVLKKHDALLIADVQTDFLPGGALGVHHGDKILPIINHLIAIFEQKQLPVFASRDWHPPEHSSFKSHGGPWPPHCIQNTPGAELSPELKLSPHSMVFSKGVSIYPDEYSAFKAQYQDQTLVDHLRSVDVQRLFITGLATDYCVLNTALDALKYGYETYVVTDAIMGIDVAEGDAEKALQQMEESGANLISSKDIHVD